MAFLDIGTLVPASLTADERQRCERALATTRIALGRRLDWAGLFSALDWPLSTAVICDNQTWHILAESLVHTLQANGHRVTLINLGSQPHATMEMAQYILAQASTCEALIAVGSGTINDLAKFSAHQARKPYSICGTAPSMNGYLSANAAMTVGGHKQSLSATLPRAALFDLDILQSAPDRLYRAGIGDSVCRPTAQADWLLSHHVLNTPYDPLPFKLLQPFEAEMLKGKTEALITTLLLSGLGMTLCDGSYPASQGEHLLSHYLEMRHPEKAEQCFHGEQIAVTTLFMSALQHGLLQMNGAPQWQESAPLPDEAYCIAHFGEETGASVWQAWQEKRTALSPRSIFNERLAKNWQDIRQDIASIALPYAAIDRALQQASAPRIVQDLGFTPDEFSEAVHHAHLIRNRFTFLDLAMLARVDQPRPR